MGAGGCDASPISSKPVSGWSESASEVNSLDEADEERDSTKGGTEENDVRAGKPDTRRS